MRKRPEQAREVADSAFAEQERLLAPLVDGLTQALWHEQGYRAALVERLEAGLAKDS